MRTQYVMARSSNGRPLAQHIIGDDASLTKCGRELTGWSRSYTLTRIDIICCLRCASIHGLSLPQPWKS